MFYPIHPNELLAIPPLKLDINYTAKVIFQALIKIILQNSKKGCDILVMG